MINRFPKSELYTNNNNKRAISNIIQKLISEGLISLSSDQNFFVPNFKKAYEILNEYSIRGIGNTVDILFNKKVVGQRSLPQAIEELHRNAIYFLSGKRYQVKKLHYDAQPQNNRIMQSLFLFQLIIYIIRKLWSTNGQVLLKSTNKKKYLE